MPPKWLREVSKLSTQQAKLMLLKMSVVTMQVVEATEEVVEDAEEEVAEEAKEAVMVEMKDQEVEMVIKLVDAVLDLELLKSTPMEILSLNALVDLDWTPKEILFLVDLDWMPMAILILIVLVFNDLMKRETSFLIVLVEKENLSRESKVLLMMVMIDAPEPVVESEVLRERQDMEKLTGVINPKFLTRKRETMTLLQLLARRKNRMLPKKNLLKSSPKLLKKSLSRK